MSLKAFMISRAAENILGEKRLLANRAKFERRRRSSGETHLIEFFHDPADPYSQLLQKILPAFEEKYNAKLITHIVGPPSGDAAPERERLAQYAKHDALRLARAAGIGFSIDETTPPKTGAHTADMRAAEDRRQRLGHYLGGMLYYGGEWYWGLDRLHYLEARLSVLGLRHAGSKQDFIYTPPDILSDAPELSTEFSAEQDKKDRPELHCPELHWPELHWYVSFRSPYSAIARDRVHELAAAYGAALKIRFVLPMVMRGLPVPPAKKKYIPLDTAREARRLGVAFGRVVDPVGRPVEWAYSLLPWARAQGRGYEFTRSWLSGVWAEGLDAGHTKDLHKIVARAGLSWSDAQSILGNEDWRAEAEVNRAEMMEMGIWGVPSFRLEKTIVWGQDRLWVIEEALKARIKQHR